MVNNIALICKVSIQESSKNHYLIIRDSYAAQLGPLLFLELAIKINQFPSLLLHVVRLSKVDPFDSTEGTTIVDGATPSDRIDERLSEEASCQ